MMNYTKIIYLNLIVVLIIVGKRSATGTNSGPSHNKAVFCYFATYADHRPGRGNFKLEDVNPTLCTHLVYAFVLLNQMDDSLYLLAPWVDLIVDENGKNNITKLKSQYPHLKVTISIGGWNDGSVKYSAMAANSTKRSKFVNSTIKFLKKHDFDGVDMAWSHPSKRGGSRNDKRNFAELLKDLRSAFDHHNYVLTASLDSSKDTMDYGYDVPKLSKYLDYMLVWSFDFNGMWSRFIGHNAPLYTNNILNVDYAMTYLIKLGADPSKLLLGISSSGRAFIALDVIDMSAKLPALGTKFKNYTFSGPYTEEDTGFLGYNEVCLEFKESPTKWKIFWDDFAKVPFAIHEQEFITYDNVKSVREKVKFGNSKNLGGVMIWAVDTDDFRGDCYQEGDEFENYPVLRTVNAELALGKKDDYDNFIEQNDEKVAAVLESSSIRLKINLFVIINSMIAVYYLNLM